MRNQTKQQRLREEAKLVMWNYYKENKDRLPKWIRECREEILTELLNGEDVEVVFLSILSRGDGKLEIDRNSRCNITFSVTA